MPTWPHANNRCFHMFQPQTNGRINDRCGPLRKCPSFVAKWFTAAPLIERSSWLRYDFQLCVFFSPLFFFLFSPPLRQVQPSAVKTSRTACV